jgi:IclR family transcriptional regulator, acetate operon repressor
MTPDNVKTAVRTLDLFEVFARVQGPLSLTELANMLGSPASSTHALVKTLRQRGYVYVLEDRKLILPTKRILAVAELIARSDPIVEMFQPEMEKLLAATDETIILGKRQGDYITYLEVLESRRSIRYSAKPGDIKPLHSSAIGKAMLSVLSEPDLLAIIRKVGLKRVTESTIVTIDALMKDIRAGRKKNLFITRGENVPDVMALAVSIKLGGEPLSIAIAGPIDRVSKKEAEYAKHLAEVAQHFAEMEKVSAFA